MKVVDAKERMNLLLVEKQRNARLQALRKDTLRKADFLKRKTIIEYHDVYNIIKGFFKEFLEKRYEFTINELRSELKKVYISNATRVQISRILDYLEAAEYATVHYSRDDLLKILAEFDEIVKQLVRVHTGTKPFLERLKGFFFKEEEHETIIAELPALESPSHVRIYTLIEKCYVALDRHNLHRAKTAYEVLLKEYGKLDDDAKAEHYEIIQQTYRDLMARAKMLE